MKKTLLISCLTIAFITGYTQIVELYPVQNVFLGSVSDTEPLHVNYEVINATNETIDFGCKRLGIQEVPGTVSQFCWGTLCSAWGQGNNTSSEIVTLAPDAYTSTFYAKYNPQGIAGQTIIRYCWFDTNNTMNEFCYDVNYCVDAECIVGIDESAAFGKIEQITPNPIQNTGSIVYGFQAVPNAGKLTIYNSLGGLVKEIALTKKNGAVIISAADFENGIYFCNIQNDGRVYETHRLVIAK